MRLMETFEQKALGVTGFWLSPCLGACLIPVASRLDMTTSVAHQSPCDDLPAFHKMRSLSLQRGGGLYFKGSTEGVERPLGEAVRWQPVSKK